VERQQQLENALDAAGQADRAKSIFLAAASHDLRQPLQTLNLLQATLSRQAENAETQALAAEMGHAVDVMNGMLISLLDINRLESGTLSPSATVFPVNELFDSALRDFRQPIADKGLELRVVRSRISVRSDRRILEEMIRNILSNAVRYTERGRILVGCRRAGDKAHIEIWDTGVGIMGEHLPRIFEEYYQAPGKAQYGGFGLGLAIVQRLGTVLGHRIDVRSVPGKGSGFLVEVPIGTPVAVAAPAPDVSSESVSLPRAVLVIEDDSSVRTSLDSLLRSAGARVVAVATAHDALSQIAEKGVRPDVVVSDYNLPGKMNGVEAVKALRQALGWDVPAIVLTGDTRKEVTEELARRGIEVSFKPIDGDRLLRRLMALHDGKLP
jgi:CheY-like chemotaxis protein